MPYIPPEVLREIEKVDLKTYLKEYEPRELVHFSGDVYTTRTQDSIKILSHVPVPEQEEPKEQKLLLPESLRTKLIPKVT